MTNEAEQPQEIHVMAQHGRLRCIVQGDGPPLLFLHGALGTGRAHFRGQINEFASDYRVIVPNFLGHGGSDPRESFDDFYERDTEDIAALIENLELPPVHLCGFSDGAIVAMMVAGDHPDRLRSLTLISGQAVLDEQTMETTRQLSPASDLPDGFQQALARSHGSPYWEGMVDDYVASAERIYQTEPRIVGDRLDTISCPTLIVQGEEDDWAGARHARMLRDSIRGAELDLLPGVGHEAHREDPEAFNKRLQGFLASLEE